MTPKDLSREHAALVRAAMEGQLSRRQLMARGVALGLSASAIAGLLGAYRPARALAQGTPAAQSSLAGQSIDMTILCIAGCLATAIAFPALLRYERAAAA